MSSSDIINMISFFYTLIGAYMSLYQVIHIDIVPHSRPVWRIIIIPEYVECISFPESNVEDIRKEVVRNALRSFSDPS